MSNIYSKIIFLALIFLDLNTYATDVANLMVVENLTIYIGEDHNVYLQEVNRGEKKTLNVTNFYKFAPGCYISCVNKTGGTYQLKNGLYNIGVIRVKGKYENNQCFPTGFEYKDITEVEYFKKLCAQHFEQECFNQSCAIDNNTGFLFEGKLTIPTANSNEVKNDPFGDTKAKRQIYNSQF